MKSLKEETSLLKQLSDTLKKLTEYANALGTEKETPDTYIQITIAKGTANELIKNLNSSLKNWSSHSHQTEKQKIIKETNFLLNKYQETSEVLKRKESQEDLVESVENSQLKQFQTVGDMETIVIQEKNQEYHEIQKDMQELREMMLDVNQLVESQGKQLLNVEKDQELGIRVTTAANEQLEQARYYNNSFLKKVLCIIAMAALVPSAIVFALFHL